MAISTSAPDRASSHQADEVLRAKQMEQAEELLFSGQEATGFAKALFRGEFRGDALFPYPELPKKNARPSFRRSPQCLSLPTCTSTPRPLIARPIFRARS